MKNISKLGYIIIIYKICTVCNKSKELNYFSNKKNGKYAKRSCCKECTNKLRKLNKEELNRNNRAYYRRNKELILESKKEYYSKNINIIRKKRRIYENNRYLTDSIYRLSKNIRSSINKSTKKGNYIKHNKVHNIIGCEYTELLNHLNNNEYGFIYETGLFDIDHIIPLSSAISEEELIKLNHYTNLQLLPIFYNRNIKSDKKWDKYYFEIWLNNNKSLYL